MQDIFEQNSKKAQIKRSVELVLKGLDQDESRIEVRADSHLLQEVLRYVKQYDENIIYSPSMLKQLARLDKLGVIPESLYPAVAEIIAAKYKSARKSA